MGGALWGYCLGPGTGKNCWHWCHHQKYHPGSDIQQVLALYLFGWINAFFAPLFWDPQAACTGCDRAAIWNIDSWPHTNIIRPSNLLYLFSWINSLGSRPITPPRNIFKIKLGQKMQWLWYMDMTKDYVVREKLRLWNVHEQKLKKC